MMTKFCVRNDRTYDTVFIEENAARICRHRISRFTMVLYMIPNADPKTLIEDDDDGDDDHHDVHDSIVFTVSP